MLQEGNIKSASNKARIAEYQKTIHYLQMKIDFLDRENKVWDFCSMDEMSMSRDGCYADFGNDEESKDREEKYRVVSTEIQNTRSVRLKISTQEFSRVWKRSLVRLKRHALTRPVHLVARIQLVSGPRGNGIAC
jgi:hypothetical protein